VIWSDRFVWGLIATISDSALRAVAEKPLIGNIDQWSDSTDLRSNPAWRRVVRGMYE
jgi:hypothetical protein